MPGRGSADDVLERLRRLEGTGTRAFSDPSPITWSRTAGSHVWDCDGRRYLDLYAGFAVAAVGWCHPKVTEAICHQAATMTHCPSAVPSEVRAEFYERLTSIAPSELVRVLPALNGALANETAVALARTATGRRGVVAFSGGYFGRSRGTVGFAGKQAYRSHFDLDAEATFLPFPDPYRNALSSTDPSGAVLALLEEALTDPASGLDSPACILVEPVQGNAGVVIPPQGFLAGLRALADRCGALLIFDEIQCGFGRTGARWACEHERVVPDLMTVGKGLGGGMPVAAVLGRDEVMTTWEADAVTSTFLTNAVNLAAAVAAIEVLESEQLVERSRVLGDRLLALLAERLHAARGVGEVRGRGLFVGIELVEDPGSRAPDAKAASAGRAALRDRGVLVGQGGRFGNVLKVSPPLVVDEGDLAAAADLIGEVLS